MTTAPHHNLTLDYLTQATVTDLVALAVPALVHLDAQVAQLKEIVKLHEAKLTATYERKYGERAKTLLADEGRDTGTAHVPDNGWDVTVSIPKKVDWDQDKLKTELDTMPAELAKHLAKVEVKIDERKYAALEPALQLRLLSARTVRPGKPTYTFKQLEQEAA